VSKNADMRPERLRGARGTAPLTSPCELFTEHLGKRLGTPFAVAPELERALARVWADGHAAWPSVHLAPETLVPCLAQHFKGDARDAAGIARSLLEWEHATDLYLACACLGGDSGALEAFERRFISGIRGVSTRLGHSGVPLDDIQQALREKLFVGHAGKPPAIAEYGGGGPLASWVFVVAARVALNLLRAVKAPLRSDDEKVLALPAAESNQELAYFKTLYQEEFSTALKDAMASLCARDKNLLRQHYLDGVTLKQLAHVYGVHRVTVVHWAERARTALRDRTLELLLERLDVTALSLRSIARLVQSQLAPNLASALADTGAATPKELEHSGNRRPGSMPS
jgi:RNA polymerase sigma-70 factor (ECF subfamily)